MQIQNGHSPMCSASQDTQTHKESQCNEKITNDEPPKLNAFWAYIASQTRLPSLILYSNLFWYLFIIFSFGLRNMPKEAWVNAVVLASFVCMTLNAAAYVPDTGYFRNYFKVVRFWIIPFSVSSISVACSSSKGECMMLFPTDPTLLLIHIGTIIFIMTTGSLIHRIVLRKTSVGQKHDGPKHDGETPNGQTQDNQTPDGQTHDGQTYDGQTSGGPNVDSPNHNGQTSAEP